MSSGSFGFAWVHSEAPWDRSCSHGFTRARTVVIGFEWVNLVAPQGTRVHLGIRGFTQGIIRVRVVSLGFIGFAWVQLVAPRVHSCVLGFTLGITWFIRVRMDSLGRALVWPGSAEFACVLSGPP